MKPVISLKNIYKIYKMGDTEVPANNGISLDIHQGEFAVIMGQSGSGKSTLMNIIGCLDRPTEGSYFLDGKEVSAMDDDELANIRNQKIGFIFQKFHLLAGTSAEENVEMPMIYSGIGGHDRRQIALKSLKMVALEDRANHNPNELSGGQMQRVAIARALVNKPSILLADEPTGNLDSKSGYEIMGLFQELHKHGSTIVLITHNEEMAKYGTRVIKLYDGNITSDEEVKEAERIIVENGFIEKAGTGKLLTGGRMNVLQSFKVAWNALKANKMRSLLTMLGIIIGVAAVIVMTSIGEGTRDNVMQQIYAMGSNLIFIRQGDRDSVISGQVEAEFRRLTEEDLELLKEKCTLINGIAPQISRSVTVRYYTSNLITNLIGTSPAFFKIRNFKIEKGRIFNEEEMKNRATVCVLGSYVAERLFGEHENPIGKTIKISRGVEGEDKNKPGIRLTIIGVLEEKGETFGQDNDKQIVVPFNTIKYRVFSARSIQVIFLEAKDSNKIEETIQEIKRVLAPLHNNNPKNITVESQEEIIKRVEATMGAFTFMLGGIAFVSLLVGGIGIMNIMLVSVTERTREIGLRKAIGARKSDILFQFLIEALVLSLTGGIIGISIGLGLSKLYSIITAASALKMLSKTFISVDSILLSFSFSAMVGIFFGLYPARKAANLDPIDALRYE